MAQAGEKSQCFAVVKVAGKEVGEFGDANGTVSEYGDLSGALIEDVITPDNSRWMPRWQYVVKSLRARTLHEFYKDGSEIPRDEPEIVEGGADAGGDTGSQEIVEDNIAVYSGSIGQIIGPKGAKIKEIKDASKVVAINTPAKDEDGPRPKARDYVDVEIKGTQYNINKAKALIQAVVDEWVSSFAVFNIFSLTGFRPMLLVLLVKIIRLLFTNHKKRTMILEDSEASGMMVKARGTSLPESLILPQSAAEIHLEGR